MSVPITHAKTVTIPDPTQADLDAQIALGNYPPGTVLANIALASDYNDDHVISTAGASEGYVLKVVGGEAEWATPGSGSALYLSTAFTSQTSVLVTHNFGAYPLVDIFDNAGAVIIPLTITHGSLNAFTVTFSVSTTGTILSTAGGAGGGGTPAGSTKQIQYNDAGAFAADADLAWNSSTSNLEIAGGIFWNGFDRLIGPTGGSLNWSTPFRGTVTFSQGQSGQYISFVCQTAEGKFADFTHYDVANAKGRLFDIATDPAVALAFSPSRNELLRMNGFGTADITSSANWIITSAFAAKETLKLRSFATTPTADILQLQDATGATNYVTFGVTGKQSFDTTITAAGTTGARTINKPSGTVNFAAAATSLVVTNSLCTTSSIVMCVVRTNDTTATIKNVVPAAGSFTINLGAAATAETSVGFIVYN